MILLDSPYVLVQTPPDAGIDDVTIGLVNAIIALAHVLAERNLTPPNVELAVLTLRVDAALRTLVGV
jgi:hypothetical protein